MFTHNPHPHTIQHQSGTVQPVHTNDAHVGINGHIALAITNAVGTMYAAYLFALFATTGLPAALSGGPYALVGWVSSYFLQLVLLPIIIVGQNIQSTAMNRQAVETLHNVAATLHEIQEVQRHLAHQDAELARIVKRIVEEAVRE